MNIHFIKEVVRKGPASFALGLAVGILVFSLQSFAATGFPAPGNPPNNNAPAPLNVDYGGQEKLGGIAVRGLASSTTALEYGLRVLDGKVGFGTYDPQTKLHVVGQVRIEDGSAQAGEVLTAIDSDGTAEWRPAVNAGGAGGLALGPCVPHGELSPDVGHILCPVGHVMCGLNELADGAPVKTEVYCAALVDKSSDEVVDITGPSVTVLDYVIPADMVINSAVAAVDRGLPVHSVTIDVPGVTYGWNGTVVLARLPDGYHLGDPVNVCSVAARTFLANKVKIDFYNNTGALSCVIPAGTYKLHMYKAAVVLMGVR